MGACGEAGLAVLVAPGCWAAAQRPASGQSCVACAPRRARAQRRADSCRALGPPAGVCVWPGPRVCGAYRQALAAVKGRPADLRGVRRGPGALGWRGRAAQAALSPAGHLNPPFLSAPGSLSCSLPRPPALHQQICSTLIAIFGFNGYEAPRDNVESCQVSEGREGQGPARPGWCVGPAPACRRCGARCSHLPLPAGLPPPNALHPAPSPPPQFCGLAYEGGRAGTQPFWSTKEAPIANTESVFTASGAHCNTVCSAATLRSAPLICRCVEWLCTAAPRRSHTCAGLPAPRPPCVPPSPIPSPLLPRSAGLHLLRAGGLDLVHHLALWPGPG